MSPIQTSMADERCISQAVIETIAEAKGIDPLEVTPPLYDVIDPDALEDLFTDSQIDGTVTFTYSNFEVSVYSDTQISVENNDR